MSHRVSHCVSNSVNHTVNQMISLKCDYNHIWMVITL